MAQSYILASDLGTGSCKTVVVDANGMVVAFASREYPMHYPRQGWCEQDPQDWLEAACWTVRAALEEANISPSQIEAYGLVGVTHNAVLLDESGRPLRPCITFYDTRSQAESDELHDRWGATIFRRTWNSVSPLWTWPQLLWIKRHEPQVWRSTRKILFEKDYVRNILAPSSVSDRIDVEGTLLYDPIQDRWIEEFFEDLGLPEAILPEVVSPAQVVGHIDECGAALTGLLVGTPVVAGTTDTAAEVLGAGALRPGQATVKLASVGRITSVSTSPANHPQLLNYRHVIDDLWYPGTATKFASSAFRWLRDALWGEGSYEDMDAAAMEVPPGSDGLLFHPHLDGEWAPYWDSQLRGDFIGLTVRHDRRHLTRAVMEGVALALRAGIEYTAALGLTFDEVRLIGQGGRSDLWAQIIADCLNRPILIPAGRDAAYGAALLTGMGVGFFPDDPGGIEGFLQVEDQRQPDPEIAELYNKLFFIYQESDAALRSISQRLDAFERRYQFIKEDLSKTLSSSDQESGKQAPTLAPLSNLENRL